MRYRTLGSSGISASVVAFGAWGIGGWMWGGTEEKSAIRAIHAALDHGINLIDTAPVYGFGVSEGLVGRAIRGRRDQVILATKCGMRWNSQEGEFFFASTPQGRNDQGPIRIHKYLGAESIRTEVEQSLARLGTDRIDLYQTHWQDPTTPIEETMRCLLDLKREGKIRAIGVSNATPEQIEEYRRLGEVAADQEPFSLLKRKLEEGQLQYCQRHSIAVLAYSPLEHGLLTGDLDPDRSFEKDEVRQRDPRFSRESRVRMRALKEELGPLLAKYQKTLAELVIAWTVAEGRATHALVGARTEEQVKLNARAGTIELSAEDDQLLESSIARVFAQS